MFHKSKHARGTGAQPADAPPLPAPVVARPYEVSGGLRRIGLSCWLFVGVVVAVGVVISGLLVTAGIVVPLIFAFYFGAVLFPLVDWLERRGVPRWVASLLMVVLAIVAMIVAAVVVIVGIADQAPQISAHLDAATKDIQSWLTAHNVSAPTADQIKSGIKAVASHLSGGVLSAVASGVDSLVLLGFGLFLALNILYWVEQDGRRIARWASGHVGLPGDVVLPILRGAVTTLQRYFYGVTIIAALNGVIVAGGALLLGTPLALTIGLVTFLAAYIPYFGAIIGGAFAVLIALGSGGTADAI
jgi:putative heme transporter